MKLSPTIEEEEGFATRVVEREQPAVTETEEEEWGLEEFTFQSVAQVLRDKGAGSPHDVEELDIEISDDESNVGDDGDSAVGGIKRKRTVRVVIRSRAFL